MNGLEWNGMEWIGLDWIGLDWIGLDWIAVPARRPISSAQNPALLTTRRAVILPAVVSTSHPPSQRCARPVTPTGMAIRAPCKRAPL
jgi:hypothetical protein